MRKILLVLGFFIIFVFTLFPQLEVAYAQAQAFKQCPQGEVWSPDFQICIPTDAPGFASKIYQLGLALIGFVAVIFLIFGGYNIMMSRGNVEQLERGKSYVFYAIAGVLLAIFGFVFIEIITGDILRLPGFGR